MAYWSPPMVRIDHDGAEIDLGLTYNFKNPDTQYQNGIDFHFDWGMSQFLSKQVFVGFISSSPTTRAPTRSSAASGRACSESVRSSDTCFRSATCRDTST
jgi:hypothetical protein